MSTTAAPADTQPTIRATLGHARFRRLLTALAISQAGDWLYNVALVALVLDRTHSLTWVAVTTAARVTPMIVGGPFGGVVADRFDRRLLMAWSDAVRAVCMAGLAAVALLHLPVVLAPVLAAIATAASTPYPPSVAATTPRLVSAELLPAANAARAAISSICIVAGPAFGAVLLLVGSTTVAFLVNGATFVVSALLVLSLPRGAAFAVAREESAAGVRAELASGARALLEQPVAMRLVGADFLCSAVYGAHTVLLLLLAHEMGVGDAGYGYLLGAFGLGGVAGTVLTGRIAGRLSPRSLLLVAGVAVGIPAVLLGVPAPFVVLMAWAVVVGAGAIVVEVATDTALQTSVAPEVLARAYGISFPAAVSGIVLGSLVAAPAAAALGVRGALVVVGAAMCAYVVAVVRTMPRGAASEAAGSVPSASPCETLPA
ncbi:MAG: MFS transporter [Marmoricola sp.]|nr:MFS transporter [Marmoricola sp.]